MTIPSPRVGRLSNRETRVKQKGVWFRTVDHSSVLFPASFDKFQTAVPIYLEWAYLHHEPIKGRAPWPTLAAIQSMSV